MSDLALNIGGRRYTVSCPEGQESRVQELAQHVDVRVREITGAGAAVGEGHSLALAAMVIADEALGARDAQAEARQPAAPDPVMVQAQAAAAKDLAEIAGQIRSVAGRLKAV